MAKKTKMRDNRHHLPLREDTELLDRLDTEVKTAHGAAAWIERAISQLYQDVERENRPKVEPKYAKRLMETVYIIDSLFDMWSCNIHYGMFQDLKASIEALEPNYLEKDQRPHQGAKLDKLAR